MADTDITTEPDDTTSVTGSTTLPLMPIPGGVVLPEMVVTVALETDESQAAAGAATDDLIVLVPKIDNQFSAVGAVAHIENRGTLRDGLPALTIRATHRALIGAGILGTGATLWVEATPLSGQPSTHTKGLAARYSGVASKLLEQLGGG